MNINDKYKTVYEWGKAYRKIGWNVIPLYDNTKIPSKMEYKHEDFGWLVGWTIFKDRMATDEEYEHWFKKEKPTGLGVITGKLSGLVVVDEDSYKGDGMKFEFESPLKSRTGRGGFHHFFKYTEPVKTSGFRKGVNIEIKSDGGFAILPPTVSWKNDKHTEKGTYQWETFCALENLPTITEQELAKYKGGTWNGEESSDLHELVGAQLGEQHNSLRTIALKMFARFPEREWDIASKFIREEAARFDPPHPVHRVETIIKDCSKYIHENRKGDLDKIINKPLVLPRSVRDVADEREIEKALEKIAPSTGYTDLDKIIKGFIPGHLYTLTGNENVGKTTIACNFADRIRKQGKKVLYFALEPENTVVDYLASIRTNKLFDALTREDRMYDDGNISIYGKQEISTLADLLFVVRQSSTRYDLIIIDHIGYFIRNTNNTNQEQSNTIKELAWLAKEKKMAIMMIAHLRKQPVRSKKDYIPTSDDISGSGSFKQDSTEVMIVTRPRQSQDPKEPTLSNLGYLIVTKTKCGPNGYIELCFSEKRALIMSPEEVLLRNDLSASEKLTLTGYPTTNTVEPEKTEDVSLDEIGF